MKYIRFLGRYLLVPLALIAVGAVGASYLLVSYGKDLNRNANWYNLEGGGIDESRFVELGGFDQFVRIRGRHPDNPVLLDLHGGPGSAMSDYSHRFYRPLTEYFTLVEWDQRGARQVLG